MEAFSELLPERILNAVIEQGLKPTGSLFPLNSYENRVYLIDLEEREPIVAKFYRPGRWSAEAIGEEHLFIRALAQADIPVIEPLPLARPIKTASTISQAGDFYYALYPKFRGREHAEITNADRKALGKTLARLHNIGERFPVVHRPSLNPSTFGYASLDYILRQTFIPKDLLKNLEVMLRQCLELTEPYFQQGIPEIAVHGDCHPGNILWDPLGPHLLDFDDMVAAPAVQDLWMLFNGDAEEQDAQMDAFFEGYESFRRFDDSTLNLAEPLRTLRIVRHAAWIGQRYEEPGFQRAFPYFQERRYWEEFLLSIKEQIGLLQEL